MNVRARACRTHFKFITMQQTCDIRRSDTRICYSGTKLWGALENQNMTGRRAVINPEDIDINARISLPVSQVDH